MWSFEGEYRRRPQQRLGGASLTRNIDRSNLLTQLKQDREEREKQRGREAAALTIQSWTRAMLSQRRTKHSLRQQLDTELSAAKQQRVSEGAAIRLIALLIRVFHPQYDSERLLSVCQLLIREQQQLGEWVGGSLARWTYLLPRLASMGLVVISQPVKAGESTTPHGPPLRLLEVLLNPDTWLTKLPNPQRHQFLAATYTYLIRQGCYRQVVAVLVSRVPEVYEATVDPPTPLAQSLMALLVQPLAFAASTNHPSLPTVIEEVCQHVFGGGVHSQVLNFVIPCLASSTTSLQLPMDRLVAVFGQRAAHLLTTCPAPSLLYSLLLLVRCNVEFTEMSSLCNYLQAISVLLGGSTAFLTSEEGDSESDDSDDEAMDSSKPLDPVLCKLAEECVSVLNSTEHVGWLLRHVERQVSAEVLLHFSRLIHHLLTAPSVQLRHCSLLYRVAVQRQLLRSMWTVLSGLHQGAPLPGTTTTAAPSFGVKGTPLLQVLARGSPLTPQERDTLVPLLATFCATLTAVLSTLHDSEFLGHQDEAEELGLRNSQVQFPFSVSELVKMSASLRDVCVGLVELAHPDVRMSATIDASYKTMWAHCFKVCLGVVRQIHLRDTRRQFCPKGHWLSSRVSLPLPSAPQQSGGSYVSLTDRRRRRLFQPQRWLTRDELESEGPPLSITEQCRATILQELPFVIPFEARTQVFSTLVAHNRRMSQMRADFNEGPMISVVIRRTHIYEDAFEKLSLNNQPNLRLRMRVQLMNAAGLNEVGIDGGGIFREFLSELLKTAFDPTRGFFLLTRENTLYPNPGARFINPDYQAHYYFIGRMLGKALYENLLVEVPLAGFFVSKLLGRSSSSSVEFHHLDSLDPELCKNLLSLKTYQGDVQDLGLDFTVLNSDLGQNTIEELIPGGSEVPVTNENRIEYIYRMADYKLNRQILVQSQAFKKGVTDVVPLEWLQMFDWRELQMLISGASVPIDVADLQENTRYGGVYTTEHPTIQAFWSVLRALNEPQKRQLLKFVTSCSRPPLLGFKELQPAFCIQPSGTEDRLPSASTCMNLLKLPEYKDEHTLKEKLLYAVSSSAGFELS